MEHGGYEVSVFLQKNEAAWKHSTLHSSNMEHGGYEVSVFLQTNEAAWKHSALHSGCRKEGDRQRLV